MTLHNHSYATLCPRGDDCTQRSNPSLISPSTILSLCFLSQGQYPHSLPPHEEMDFLSPDDQPMPKWRQREIARAIQTSIQAICEPELTDMSENASTFKLITSDVSKICQPISVMELTSGNSLAAVCRVSLAVSTDGLRCATAHFLMEHRRRPRQLRPVQLQCVLKPYRCKTWNISLNRSLRHPVYQTDY